MFMRRVKIKPNLNRVTKPAPCSPSFQIKSDPSSPVSKSHPTTPIQNKSSAPVEEEEVKEVKLLNSPAKTYSRQQTNTVELVPKTEVKSEKDEDEPDIAVTSVIPPPTSKQDASVEVLLIDEKPELVTPETSHASLNQDVQTPRIGVTAPDLDTKPEIDAIPETVSSIEPEVESILPTIETGALTAVAAEPSILVDFQTESASVSSSDCLKTGNQSSFTPNTDTSQATESISSSTAAEESVSSAPSRSESPVSVGQVCNSVNRYDDSTVVNTNIQLESEPHRAPSEKPQKRIKSEKEASRYRRMFQKNKEPPERSKMTMMDLIYYNPTDNPMTVSAKRPSKDTSDGVQSKNRSLEDPPEVPAPALTPRVKIGEDGQIILDEESLVIEHTVPDGFNVVVEDSETTYFSFRDRVMTRRWNQDETALFYKGLTLFGTDFSLMSQIMQIRTRHELKLKFKKEERRNRKLIDVILRCQGAYGIAEFQNDVEEYMKKSEQEEESRKKREKGKRSTKKTSPGKRGHGRKSGEDSDVESIAQSEYASCGSPSLSTVDPGEESLPDSVPPRQTELIEITCLVEETETTILPDIEDPQHANHSATPALKSNVPVKKQKKPYKPRKRPNTVCDKKSQPTCDKNSQPACDKNSQPVCDKNSQSVCDKNSQPVCDKKSQPACNKNIKPSKIKPGKKRKQVLGPLKSKKVRISKSDVQPQPSNIICQTENSIASQEIILLSETGEVLPLEVVYDQPSLDCSLPEKAEVISSSDEVNRQREASSRPSSPAVPVEYQELENTLTAIFGEGGL